ncbi:MAG: Tsi3 family protein [Pseudomonadota bacterium]
MKLKQIGIVVGAGVALMFVASQDRSDVDGQHQATGQAATSAAVSFQGGGISVRAPEGFTAKSEPKAVIFTESGQIRTPLQVRIDLQPDGALPDATEERRITDGLARYKIEELDGGSGGQVWQLNAIKETPKGALMMRASQQTELGPPDFAMAWEIFETAQISD